MPKESAKLDNRSESKRLRKPETLAAELTEELVGLERLPGGLAAAFGAGTIESQASRLGDASLQSVQRQALAGGIGRTQGNVHLQRVVQRLIQDEPEPEEQERYPVASHSDTAVQRVSIGGIGSALGGLAEPIVGGASTAMPNVPVPAPTVGGFGEPSSPQKRIAPEKLGGILGGGLGGVSDLGGIQGGGGLGGMLGGLGSMGKSIFGPVMGGLGSLGGALGFGGGGGLGGMLGSLGGRLSGMMGGMMPQMPKLPLSGLGGGLGGMLGGGGGGQGGMLGGGMMAMQQQMQKQQQMFQMISNMIKMQHQTAMAAIRNIR